MKQPVSLPILCVATLQLLAALVHSGCNSAATPRDLMLEEAMTQPIERPVAMRGDGEFLEGKVGVLATVSRGFDRGPGKNGDRRLRRRPDGSVFDPDGGFRKRDEFGAFGEVYNVGGYGDSEEEQREAIEDYMRIARARRAAGSPMPPVTLRVAFENRGTEPLELEVTEVNSDLGNFAVRPPKLLIAPGETGVLEPMISQLGVTSDEIPLKVAVRSAGKREQQVIVVKNIIAKSLRKEFEELERQNR